MSQSKDQIWSNTDYPYACLIDEIRTNEFRRAIQKVVKPGDVVIDVGTGSGIFALFAAEAGASKVYAVEIDPVLTKYLKETFSVSKYSDVIELVADDALEADLPKNVDVVIAELIETGLLDEMQAPVMNNFHERGIIGSKTKLIPQSYEVYVELVNVKNNFFGHEIKAPIHMWPHYKSAKENWYQVDVTSLTDKVLIKNFDFRMLNNDLNVDEEIQFEVIDSELKPNAIRISGKLTLCDDIILGDTNAVNGDKIIHLLNSDIQDKDVSRLHISYIVSGGLGGFTAKAIV